MSKLVDFSGKSVWIFQTGEPLHVDGGNPRAMRAMNLANFLVKKECKVIVWSSLFYHQEKRHRDSPNKININDLLEYRLINSCGYKANLGFARIIDHIQLGFNLWLELRKEKQKPNVAFIGFPPIEFAFIANYWLQKRGVSTILDVKDQWPLIFLSPFPAMLKPVAWLCFSPFFWATKSLMKKVTAISTMAPGFLIWVYSFSGRKKNYLDDIYPLSPPMEEVINEKSIVSSYEWWNNLGVNRIDNSIKLIFIGSLSRAFNFKPLIWAAEFAIKNNINWQFVICGDGNESEEIRRKFQHCNNVLFPGWIDRPKQIALAKMAKIGLAPYRNVSNFQLNMPNKIIDYLSLGLPILCPLSGDVRELILNSKVGEGYDDNCSESLIGKINNLLSDDQYSEYSKNCREVYEKNFRSDAVYEALSEKLISLIH